MSDVHEKIRQASARNTQLLDTLAKTDYAAPALEQQTSFLNELRRELQRSNQKLEKLNKNRIKEQGEHEKYRDSHVRRFMHRATGQSGKFSQKAAKEEQEYFEVLQQIQEETTTNNNIEARIGEAEGALRQLEKERDTHNQAQKDLDNLYLSIFSGPTPQFPGEDEKEGRASNALQQYHNTRMKLEAESYAVDLLEQAAGHLKKSRGFMEDALQYSSWDMLGGGAATDMMERNSVSSAERETHQAMMLVMRAKQSSPFIHELPQVQFAQGNIMSDVMFDNIFTDYNFHQKLKDSRDQLDQLNRALHVQLREARQRKQSLNQEIQQREHELQDSRLDLQKYRERAFEQVAGGKSTGNPYGDAYRGYK